jgi:hypothetical protein
MFVDVSEERITSIFRVKKKKIEVDSCFTYFQTFKPGRIKYSSETTADCPADPPVIARRYVPKADPFESWPARNSNQACSDEVRFVPVLEKFIISYHADIEGEAFGANWAGN